MNLKHSFLTFAALAGLVAGAQAASVTSTGYTNDFSTQPGVADWSTLSSGADHAYTSVALLDAAVQALAASSINGAVGVSAVDPPATATTAQWSSAGLYLQTRPTGNGATLLMLTLQNNTGADALSLAVSYNLSTNPATTTELIFGHRVYYSTSGAAGSWTVVPGISGDGSPGLKNFTLDFGTTPWANGATMYILWVDHDTATNPDGGYHIDNFFAATSGATSVSITTQPTSLVALTNMPATFTVAANGTGAGYFWFKSPATFLSVGSSYTIPSVQPSDAGNYFVIVSNSINSATSTVVSLTVTQQVGWVAFNNQGTPPVKVSAYSPAGVSSGALTNVLFGNQLAGYLTITTNVGAVVTSATMNTPPAGTPAATIFTPYVNWTVGNCGLQLRTTGLVTYVFTGLDSSKTYKFAGTAIRGGGTGADYSNRWTQVELQGATAYTTNHSAGVLTSNQYPAYLTGNQVAFNAGMNNTNVAGLPTGDVVEWDNIVPGVGAGNAPTNGTITIQVKQYTNATPYTPAGMTAVPTYTYALGQIRLEESATATPVSPTLAIANNGNGTVTISWPESSVTWQAVSAQDTTTARSTWSPVADVTSITTNSGRVYLTVPANSPAHRFFDVHNP